MGPNSGLSLPAWTDSKICLVQNKSERRMQAHAQLPSLPRTHRTRKVGHAEQCSVSKQATAGTSERTGVIILHAEREVVDCSRSSCRNFWLTSARRHLCRRDSAPSDETLVEVSASMRGVWQEGRRKRMQRERARGAGGRGGAQPPWIPSEHGFLRRRVSCQKKRATWILIKR